MGIPAVVVDVIASDVVANVVVDGSVVVDAPSTDLAVVASDRSEAADHSAVVRRPPASEVGSGGRPLEICALLLDDTAKALKLRQMCKDYLKNEYIG